jgi:uncharacterized membrane protein YgcG
MARKSIKISDLLGGYDLLLQFISSRSAEITAKGLTPATLTTNLTTQKTDLVTKDTTQENAKTALRNATIAVDASVDANYPQWSSVIDLLRGAFGTTSPEGKQLTAMRKSIIGSSGGGGGGGSSSSGSGSSSSSS